MSLHYYKTLKIILLRSEVDLNDSWTTKSKDSGAVRCHQALISTALHFVELLTWHIVTRNTTIWCHYSCSTQVKGKRELSSLLSWNTCLIHCFRYNLLCKCRCRLWVTSLQQQLLQTSAQEVISQQVLETETRIHVIVISSLYGTMCHTKFPSRKRLLH